MFDSTDNTSRARSVPCITLYPCNNASGSWAFFNIITGQRIRRLQWQKMVTTEGIIGQMNGLSKEIRIREDDVREETKETEQAREIQRQEQEKATIIRIEEVQPTDGSEQGAPLSTVGNAATDESVDQECPQEIIEPRRSERIKQGVGKPSRYTAATVKLREGGHNEEKKERRDQSSEGGRN